MTNHVNLKKPMFICKALKQLCNGKCRNQNIVIICEMPTAVQVMDKDINEVQTNI